MPEYNAGAETVELAVVAIMSSSLSDPRSAMLGMQQDLAANRSRYGSALTGEITGEISGLAAGASGLISGDVTGDQADAAKGLVNPKLLAGLTGADRGSAVAATDVAAG